MNQKHKFLGQEVIALVEGIGSRGEGIARTDVGDEIFVPKTMRGDKIRVKILEHKKGRWIGEMIELIEASSERTPPPCPHFQICGGCDFQQLPYDEQIQWKARMTKHWIRRSPLEPLLGKIPFDEIRAPHAYGYRHRVRLQVKNGKIHFFYPHSHKLFEIKECPILENGFLEQLQSKASALPDTRDWSQSFSQGQLVSAPNAIGTYEMDGIRFSFDEETFTQGNLEMNGLLYKRVKEDLPESRQTLLDLYAGIGNFSLPLSRHFSRVISVESSPISSQWAQTTAEREKCTNVEFYADTCGEALAQLRENKEAFDWVILDPPRVGAWEILEPLQRLLPPKITYVSCSLETLVRDLIPLCRKGPYRIRRWTTLDLFPQTHHIESIVTLTL